MKLKISNKNEYYMGSPSVDYPISKKNRHPVGVPVLLEQDTGVEPAFTAWEAVVLPIYESCVGEGIIAELFGKFNPFLSAILRFVPPGDIINCG